MKRIVLAIFTIMFIIVLGADVIATTGTVITDTLNVRDGASTTANKIGTLNKDEEISIIAEENNWYKVQYKEQEGYVSKDYVEEKKNSENEGNEKKENEVEKDVYTKQKVLNDVDLYVLPLLNATKLMTIKKDTEVSIISNNGKWVYVKTEDNSGWLISKKIDYAQEDEEKAEEEKQEENNETTNAIDDNSQSEGNELIENNNTVEQSNIEEETNEDSQYPVAMYVTGDSVNIRKSASTSAEIISGTSKNASVKVIAKEGDWYKVDTEDGIGYIKSDLLSSQKN